MKFSHGVVIPTRSIVLVLMLAVATRMARPIVIGVAPSAWQGAIYVGVSAGLCVLLLALALLPRTRAVLFAVAAAVLVAGAVMFDPGMLGL